MGYIKTPKNKFSPCIFCDKAKIGDDDENLVVHRGEHSYVLMNLYPYNNGHLMITPYEHEERFESLSPETQLEMMKLSSSSMTILRESLNVETHLIKNCGHHIPIEASSIALNYILKTIK